MLVFLKSTRSGVYRVYCACTRCFTDDRADCKTEREDDGEDVEWVCSDHCELWHHVPFALQKWPLNKPCGRKNWFCCDHDMMYIFNHMYLLLTEYRK